MNIDNHHTIEKFESFFKDVEKHAGTIQYFSDLVNALEHSVAWTAIGGQETGAAKPPPWLPGPEEVASILDRATILCAYLLMHSPFVTDASILVSLGVHEYIAKKAEAIAHMPDERLNVQVLQKVKKTPYVYVAAMALYKQQATQFLEGGQYPEAINAIALLDNLKHQENYAAVISASPAIMVRELLYVLSSYNPPDEYCVRKTQYSNSTRYMLTNDKDVFVEVLRVEIDAEKERCIVYQSEYSPYFNLEDDHVYSVEQGKDLVKEFDLRFGPHLKQTNPA